MCDSEDSALVIKACNFAAQKHKSQRRKNDSEIPYVNHVLEVANLLVLSDVRHTPTLCAAVLHDVVEDTPTSIDEITLFFGKEIASIVAEVTDDTSLPKEEQRRKQIETAPSKSKAAKLVKLADKYSNLSTLVVSQPKNWSLTQIQDYFLFGKQVVDALTNNNQEVINERLQSYLYDIFTRNSFEYQGNRYPCIVASNE